MKTKLSTKEITVEDLYKRNNDFNTVGELLSFIERNNIPMDAKICVERVHDYYYENNNWGTIRKEGDEFRSAEGHNQKVEMGLFNNIVPAIKYTDEELEECKTEYTPIWCPVKYHDDNTLYLDLHY